MIINQNYIFKGFLSCQNFAVPSYFSVVLLKSAFYLSIIKRFDCLAIKHRYTYKWKCIYTLIQEIFGGGESTPRACRILAPRPGMEPVPPAVQVQGLNHWTSREVPKKYF